jgi:hypothetical protein
MDQSVAGTQTSNIGVLSVKIQTIKTWHGRKWAIVDENNNVVQLDANRVAVYPYTPEGLIWARAELSELKKG